MSRLVGSCGAIRDIALGLFGVDIYSSEPNPKPTRRILVPKERALGSCGVIGCIRPDEQPQTELAALYRLALDWSLADVKNGVAPSEAVGSVAELLNVADEASVAQIERCLSCQLGLPVVEILQNVATPQSEHEAS